jgi:photosystem II stability/assembly factor-like uncharacterized protein
MDSQKRDESRDWSREEALARRIGEALDRIAPRDAGECPDAGLIAAYHEQALQPDEIAQWESHFAICSRCRKVLAVLAASADASLAEEEVAHLGELIAAARAPSDAAVRTAKPTRPDRLAWRIRWLAPALGVAAALAVWFAMRPPWRAPNPDSSGTLIAQTPKTEPPPNAATSALEQSSKVEPKKKADTDAASLKDRAVTTAQSPNPPADARAKNPPADSNAIGKITASSGVAESAARNESREQTELNSAAAGAPAPPPTPFAPAPRLQAQARVTQEAPKPKAALGAAANAPVLDKQVVAGQEKKDEVASARTAANLAQTGRGFKSLSQADAMTESAALIKTPSGAVVWRVGKGGNIQRSADAGSTWILQASPSQEEWLAGAAVSDTVCWIVGRNGAIARTTDGEHWERIAPPPMAAGVLGKFPDLTGITAHDAQAATITASDQRRYATQDGGRTWGAQ